MYAIELVHVVGYIKFTGTLMFSIYKFKVNTSSSKQNVLYHNTTAGTGGMNLNQQNFGLGLGIGGTYLSK